MRDGRVGVPSSGTDVRWRTDRLRTTAVFVVAPWLDSSADRSALGAGRSWTGRVVLSRSHVGAASSAADSGMGRWRRVIDATRDWHAQPDAAPQSTGRVVTRPARHPESSGTCARCYPSKLIALVPQDRRKRRATRGLIRTGVRKYGNLSGAKRGQASAGTRATANTDWPNGGLTMDSAAFVAGSTKRS